MLQSWYSLQLSIRFCFDGHNQNLLPLDIYKTHCKQRIKFQSCNCLFNWVRISIRYHIASLLWDSLFLIICFSCKSSYVIFVALFNISTHQNCSNILLHFFLLLNNMYLCIQGALNVINNFCIFNLVNFTLHPVYLIWGDFKLTSSIILSWSKYSPTCFKILSYLY